MKKEIAPDIHAILDFYQIGMFAWLLVLSTHLDPLSIVVLNFQNFYLFLGRFLEVGLVVFSA